MSEEKPVGYWESIYKTFDLRFYPRIVKQSFGRTLVYVILLSFLVSAVLSTKYALTLTKFVSEAKVWVSAHTSELWPKDLSEIKIEKGILSSPVAQPFIHNWGEFTLILDTTGQIKSLDNYRDGILFTKNKILFKTKKSETETEIREYDLSKIESFILKQGNLAKGIIAEVITKGRAISLSITSIKSWLKFFFWLAFLLMVGWFFFYFLTAKIMQVLIFSLFALIINKSSQANLKYSGLINISFYALTPATIIATLVMLFGFKLPMFWLLYCLIYLVYLALGIKNSKEDIDTAQAMPSS